MGKRAGGLLVISMLAIAACGGSASTTVSCTYAATAASPLSCAEYVVPDAMSAQLVRTDCATGVFTVDTSMRDGTPGDACPTSGLVGTCTTTMGTGATLTTIKAFVYQGSTAPTPQDCMMGGGTWTPA
jgi:hypothetical protein